MTPLYDLIKQYKETCNPVTKSSLKECIRLRVETICEDDIYILHFLNIITILD